MPVQIIESAQRDRPSFAEGFQSLLGAASNLYSQSKLKEKKEAARKLAGEQLGYEIPDFDDPEKEKMYVELMKLKAADQKDSRAAAAAEAKAQQLSAAVSGVRNKLYGQAPEETAQNLRGAQRQQYTPKSFDFGVGPQQQEMDLRQQMMMQALQGMDGSNEEIPSMDHPEEMQSSKQEMNAPKSSRKQPSLQEQADAERELGDIYASFGDHTQASHHDNNASALERRATEERKIKAEDRDYYSKRSKDILEKADKEREVVERQSSALANLESAIQNMKGGVSGDYLAEKFDYAPLRSTSGAQFVTAGKEFLIGTIERAGTAGRVNQWLDQQIGKMLPQLGNSKEANMTFVAAMKADLAVKKNKLGILGNLEDKYLKDLGYVPDTIAREADKANRPYADQIQKKLSYDLRRIHEQEQGIKDLEMLKNAPITELEKFRRITPVPQGTPLTAERAFIIWTFAPGKDKEEKKENAEKIAKKAGYTFVPQELYRSSTRSEE